MVTKVGNDAANSLSGTSYTDYLYGKAATTFSKASAGMISSMAEMGTTISRAVAETIS
jgi:hypothetical protein